MKIFSVCLFALLAFFSASAQVTVDLSLNQEQFLAGESLPITVKITNLSGRPLHFGDAPNWLTFSVESVDGFVVVKNSEVPVDKKFDLESSQMGTLHVDIAPYFTISKTGRYKITATLRVKDFAQEIMSKPVMFDIVTGAKLWSQDFGVPATNGVPEMRKFSLEQANYLRAQMRLFVQLGDAAETRIYKTQPLGLAVSFSEPEAQIDRFSRLHVLWQSGAKSFSYCIVDASGNLVSSDIYEEINSRPRLKINEGTGDVLVVGGVRRPKPGDLPTVSAPVPMPATNK